MKARFGTQPQWFASLLPRDVAVVSVNAFEGVVPSSFSGIEAVVVTGSPQSVTDNPPWTAWWCEHLPLAGIPVLGVCFGAHLLGIAYGGRVARGRTREIGTIGIEVTSAGQADPLLAGLPPSCRMHSSHRDDLVEVPPGSVVLARNGRGVQAVRFAPLIYGVQFHPELTADAMRVLLEVRAQEAAVTSPRADGLEVAPIADTPSGARLLGNFTALARDFAFYGADYACAG